MEPEGSLPHSQMPATCPYPEPARSSPYPHIPLPEVPSYYPPIYAWVSQVVSFPQVSAPKHCIRLSSPPYSLHAPPISFFSILLPEQDSTLLYYLINRRTEQTHEVSSVKTDFLKQIFEAIVSGMADCCSLMWIFLSICSSNTRRCRFAAATFLCV